MVYHKKKLERICQEQLMSTMMMLENWNRVRIYVLFITNHPKLVAENNTNYLSLTVLGVDQAHLGSCTEGIACIAVRQC